MKTLVLGYGNPDRQDDGVAWWIVRQVALMLNLSTPSADEPVVTDPKQDLTLMVALQLLPEMAEIVAQNERVIFVDAHTGAIEENLSVLKLTADYKASAFTHHLTPETCLSLAEELYDSSPEALLISVRGYSFNFSTDLSATTLVLAFQAVEHILVVLEGSALH